MEIVGSVIKVGEAAQVSDKFKKRELVVETNEQYPQKISIEFQQDKTGLLDGTTLGQQVTVGINIRGREWVNPTTGEIKYFNTIVGWKIVKDLATTPAAIPAPPQSVPAPVDAKDDDLPF